MISHFQLKEHGYITLFGVFINLWLLGGGIALLILGIVGLANEDYHRLYHFGSQDLCEALVMLITATVLLVLALCITSTRRKDVGFDGRLETYSEYRSRVVNTGCENVCVLFGLLLGVVLVTASVKALLVSTHVREDVNATISAMINEYVPGDPGNQYTSLLDQLQSEGKCCGVSDPVADWRINGEVAVNGSLVPLSCCVLEDCRSRPTDENSYTEGCLSKYISGIERFSRSVGYVGIVYVSLLISIFLVFVLAIAAACVVGAIRAKRSSEYESFS